MSGKKQPPNGKLASRRSAQPSATSFPGVAPELTALLKEVYNAYQQQDTRDDNARCRWNFIFHMTDWIEDLQELTNLYQHPERYDKAAAEQIVFGFLVHAVPHLQAAARNLGVPAHDHFQEPDQETTGRY